MKTRGSEQEANIKIRRVEIVQKFFDNLISENPAARKGALLSIAALGDDEFATKLASNFTDPASRAALAQLSSSKNEKAAKSARAILTAADIYAEAQKSIVRITVTSQTSEGLVRRSTGSGFFLSDDGYLVSAAHVIPVLNPSKFENQGRVKSSGQDTETGI